MVTVVVAAAAVVVVVVRLASTDALAVHCQLKVLPLRLGHQPKLTHMLYTRSTSLTILVDTLQATSIRKQQQQTQQQQ